MGIVQQHRGAQTTWLVECTKGLAAGIVYYTFAALRQRFSAKCVSVEKASHRLGTWRAIS